jgi:predicted GNAT family acetyltransferase
VSEAVGDSTTVVDNAAEQRYEVRVGSELAGYIQYRARPGLLALIHTEVDDRFEGQGIGSQLVAGALDDARTKDLAVLPFCPFVNSWLERHPDYVDLVPEERREAFGL